MSADSKTPNWLDLQLVDKCGVCAYYEPKVKGNKLTAHGMCSIKNKYKQRTERCLKYKGE